MSRPSDPALVEARAGRVRGGGRSRPVRTRRPARRAVRRRRRAARRGRVAARLRRRARRRHLRDHRAGRPGRDRRARRCTSARRSCTTRVTGELGQGGMGVVWKATDRTLGRDVAIKVLPSAVSKDPSRLARFDREAKVLASLNHANIAAIYSLHEVGRDCASWRWSTSRETISPCTSPAARSPCRRCCRSRGRSPTASKRRTRRASCIAT